MARTFRRKESLAAVSEINVTPLIDLAFALLIIFMVTTPLLEQTISLELPIQSQDTNSQRPDVEFKIVSINKKGEIYFGKNPVTLEKLNDLLADLALQDNVPVISLRADRTLPYQKVIEVLDLLKKNELSKISLDTEVK